VNNGLRKMIGRLVNNGLEMKWSWCKLTALLHNTVFQVVAIHFSSFQKTMGI
jgi:hypothetical protein